MAASDIASCENVRKVVKQRIRQLLADTPDEGISVGDFWNKYKTEFKTLPNLTDFDVTKRSQILELFPRLCDVYDRSPGSNILWVKRPVKLVARAFGKEGSPSSKKDAAVIADLREKITEVLSKETDNTVKLNSFWNTFQKYHQTLPAPKVFGVTTRSAILDLFPDVCHIDSRKSVKYVVLNSDPVVTGVDATPSVVTDAVVKSVPSAAASRVSSRAPAVDTRAAANSFNSKAFADEFCTLLYEKPDAEMKRGYNAGNLAGTYVNTNFTGQPVPGPWPHARQESPAGRPAPPDYGHSRYGSYGTPPGPGVSFPTQPYGRGQHGDYRRHNSPGGARNEEPPPSKRMYIQKDQLNSVCQDCIERLADSKEYVSVERIEKLLLQHFTVKSIAEINVRMMEDIPCIKEHLRTLRKVNAYIQAFIKCRSVATLYELQESLKEFVADGAEFDTLHLGPLAKLPLVYEFFKFPQESDIPELTTADILNEVRDCLTTKDLWKGRLELNVFMEYLTEKRSLATPYELGLRITSMPLCIQVPTLQYYIIVVIYSISKTNLYIVLLCHK